MTINLSGKGGSNFYSVNLKPATDSESLTVSDISSLRTRFPGFSGNGDYLMFSGDSYSSPLNYYNSSGALIWSAAVTNVDANSTAWLGMIMDRGSNLLYLPLLNINTNPYSVQLSTINSSGSVNGIGIDQLPAAMYSYSSAAFNGGSKNTGGGISAQLSPDNTSQIQLRWYQTTTAYLRETTIDITDGSILGTTTISNDNYSWPNYLYKTINGIYVSSFYYSSSSVVDIINCRIHNGTVARELSFKEKNVNFPVSATGLFPVEWDGIVVLKNTGDTSYSYGSSYYLKTDFDAFFEAYAEKFGLL